MAGQGKLAAQEGSFAFQIRAGGTHPVSAFGGADAGWEGHTTSGVTLGMGFTFPFYRVFDGYVGFSQYRFGCDPDLCPRGKDWISTGFDAALRLVLGRQRLRPWIQGGFHSQRLEGKLRVPEGVETLRSDGGGGYEVGGGILVQVGERTSLAPGVRFGFGHVPFATRPTMKLRYLVADLGLVLGF
jgi:hypothetical protein